MTRKISKRSSETSYVDHNPLVIAFEKKLHKFVALFRTRKVVSF